MIIVYGIHKYLSKFVGCRREYCRACKDVRTVHWVRTLDFANLYSIPLLPLGLCKRWRYRECHERPYAPTKTRWPAKLVICSLLTLSAGVLMVRF
jgi:hypothetical protein